MIVKGFNEKEMATHSSILAWRISWTEEPGGLQSTGSQVRHDLVTKPSKPKGFKSQAKYTFYMRVIRYYAIRDKFILGRLAWKHTNVIKRIGTGPPEARSYFY